MIPWRQVRKGVRENTGFTLLEVLASIAVLAVLMLVVFQMTDQLSRVLRVSQAKIEMFREARSSFFTITQRLRQSTLNPSWEYYNSGGDRRTTANAAGFSPERYGRFSSLHFVSGPTDDLLPAGDYSGHAIFFTAPLGHTDDKANYGRLVNTVHGCGYYVEYMQESALPTFLSGRVDQKWRWRLRQFIEPAEDSIVQAAGWTDATRLDWFQRYFTSASPPVYDLADNILLLVVLPMLPNSEDLGNALAPAYTYDSRIDVSFTTKPPTGTGYTESTIYQLPPLVRVIMVAIDDRTALRLDPDNSSTPVEVIPTGLFTDSINIQADLDSLRTSLDSRDNFTYRVFDSTVSIAGAKWSQQ
jgi:uncharacterized protein (TIGR02599 family)